MSAQKHFVFVTGSTGYLGRSLITNLLQRGHEVRALVRAGSQSKLPVGSEAIVGDALRLESYEARVRPCDTFVQLVGVAHPSPSKGAQFRSVDLVSACDAVRAAKNAGAQHFVYVSVAHPAPLMKAYIEVRSECEQAIRESGLNATILRPWYILGPGHRWPYALLPVYRLMEMVPATRAGALRLGLVTHAQMMQALLFGIENPSQGIRIVEVPEIRAAGLHLQRENAYSAC
jgi:uncharacterized protein YbjT (DUF2867 family)